MQRIMINSIHFQNSNLVILTLVWFNSSKDIFNKVWGNRQNKYLIIILVSSLKITILSIDTPTNINFNNEMCGAISFACNKLPMT